jgi:CHAD domain-containing protein
MTGEDKQSQHSLTRLVEYLGGARQREAEKLLAAVERKQKPACRNIKRYKKLLQSTFADENPDTSPIALESQARSFASGMVAQLCRAKRLTARNIHPFRLKVRKLRSILELVPSSDPDLLRSLTRAKNEIGDWHDWHQLAATARQVLKQASDRPLLTRIDRIAARELSQAVEASEALRGTYLQPAPESRRPAKKRA